ncbi:MAG: hypothetical protein ACO1PI_05990 [Bacteroidota bacterium]
MSQTLTLKSLYQSIQTQIQSGSGTFNLVPDVLNTSEAIGSFYAGLIPSNIFSLSNAVLQPATWDDSLTEFTLTGQSTAFGLGNMQVSVVFSNTNAGVLSNLSATLENGTWSIDGISWFGLSNPFVGIQVYDGGLPVVGTTGGTVNLSSSVILTLSMSYPVTNNTWVFNGTFANPYPSISNFYQMVGGVNLTSSLPQPFSTLTDLGLREINVSYDSVAKSVSFISVAISTSPTYQWQILPKLAINNIDIVATVQSPSDSQNRSTSFIISGNFTIGPADSNNLVVTAVYPNFSASVNLDSGTIQLGDLLTMFWSGTTIDLNSEITNLQLEIAPSQQNYSLNTAITTDWTFFTIQSPSLSFTMTGLLLDIRRQQGSTTGKITGNFNIGPGTPDSGVDLTMFAGYDGSAWSFGASTGQNQTISLGDIAASFLHAFGMDNIPSWVTNNLPNISNVNFLATVPDDKAKPSTYQVQGDVNWHLQFGSFDLTLDANVDITYSNSKTTGKITGTADASQMLGLTFNIGYEFGDADTEVFLNIPQFSSTITYTSNATNDIIDIKFEEISLGEIVSTFVGIFSPGFTLPAPWNMLNSIDLSGFEFTYTRYKTSSQSSIVATIPINVDLGFINIKSIKITKDGSSTSGSGVYMYIEGTFLGLPIENDSPLQQDGKGSDVTNMPSVPGMGSEMFDLKLLAMGQHVSMYQVSELASVNDAITALNNAFTTTSDPNSTTIPVPATTTQPGALVFDQNSNWLIGTDFTVAKFYRVAAVFNDPNMYGLLIGVDAKADYFKNLQFEILYKKINDTIGMYQLDLQLPDRFRHLEFGEVSITLPNIGVKVYTNGNFYLDFGFPASITDFSRSFSVQVFPFIGYGGFYFGYLSGATSTSVPQTTCGTFNPVIEFGLGLSLGVGKTIEAGILKAGLSLTAVGIFQGVLGFFRANPSLQTSDGTYYKLQGTFGLTGHIYGEINFAIISARLDIMAYAYVTITIESYKLIPIYFEAGVSVSLTVKINLGLFSIKVSLHFSATVSASFTIGSDTSSSAPWNQCPPKSTNTTMMLGFSALTSAPSVVLKWQPIKPLNGAVPLDLVFFPQLTLSGDSSTTTQQYLGMLYINSGSTNNSLAALTEGVLYWAINALIGNTSSNTGLAWLQGQTITADQITQLLCYFNTRPNNIAPFNYTNAAHNDIQTFLSTYFMLNIRVGDTTTSNTMDASVFPVLPELYLNTLYKNNPGTAVPFATQTMTGTQNYIADVSELLAAMAVQYESQIARDNFAPSDCSNVTDPDYENQPNLSFPTFVFTDFVALIAKQALQGALDYLNTQNGGSATVSNTVTNAVNNSVQGIGGMASRFMLHGLRLPAPPLAASGTITPLYMLTGQQVAVPTTLATTDQYAILLQSPDLSWITMVGGAKPPYAPTLNTIAATITSSEIQRTLDLGAITLTPSLISGPSPIINYNDTPQSFSLGSPALWQYPGDYFTGVSNNPSLWKLPSNLTTIFNSLPNVLLDVFTLTNSTKAPATNYTWATTVSLSLQKITASGGQVTPLSGNMYNLVGADDAGIVYLEDLISYLNTHNDSDGTNTIQQIQILYQPDPVQNSNGGYISAANGGFKTAIVQANLSTETNPGQGSNLMAAFTALAPPPRNYNTLNTAGDFIQMLWECSIVRSGGFYFYYNTNDNKGLPDTLFSGNGVANVTLVITYDALIPAPFVNSVVIGDEIDTSKTSVFAQSPSTAPIAQQITTRVATILPGCVGYQLSRNAPPEYNPTLPIPTKDDDQTYLQTQFNLIGVSLPTVSSYKNLLPAGPADPMSEEDIANAKNGNNAPGVDATDWNYSGVIPYYRYVQPGGTDPNYPNPYAGIGTTVQMALNWQDMFGNIPPANTASLSTSMQLLYSDSIVALSQWSSVSVYYLFDLEGGKPTLDLNFAFNTTRYIGDGAQNNAQIDLLTYMTLYYQLNGGNMTINYTTSIENTGGNPVNHTADVNALLSGFITPIITMLKAVAGGATATPITPYTISTTVATTGITALPEISSLTVSLTMQRTPTLLDPNFTNVAGVAYATTVIQPQSNTSVGGMLSLTFFAQQFETAFINQPVNGVVLKVATGTNITKGNSDTTETPPLWVVRFDPTGANGIKFGFDNNQVYYFAPVPLATSLQSFSAPINGYQEGQAYPAGNAVTKSFSSVDMDNWGLLFLQAVDRFLSPAYAVPAFLMNANAVFSGDPDYLQQVLDAKQQLAEAIEGTIDFIIDPCDGQPSPPCTAKTIANIGNAQEKWKQQMLKQLSNAYRYVASVQTTATINSQFNGVNNDPPQAPYVPLLFGIMQGDEPSVPGSNNAPKSTEYSLSTAKVPTANGNSWLTYMFEAKDAAESRSFSFGDMKYKVSHIEFDIQQVPDMGNYLASSWLTFIVPLDGDVAGAASPLASMEEVGETPIPVPLRAYPTPPSISAQNTDYPVNDNNPPNPVTIQDARTWNYIYTYQNPSAAQDTVVTEVQFNVAQGQQSSYVSANTQNLPMYQSLAQFMSVYPAISADFDNYLAQLTPANLSSTNPAAINARYAMLAFIKVVQQVAKQWKQTNQVNPRVQSAMKMDAAPPPAPPYTLSYTITESAQETTEYLLVTITPGDTKSAATTIAVNIEGYTAEQASSSQYLYYKLDNSGAKQYLLYEDRNTIVSRTVELQGLDILNTQNAWSSVAVIRNEELLQNSNGVWLTTNPLFIYQTPQVMFYNKLIPLLSSNTSIDIATVGTTQYPVKPQRPLSQHMLALFDALTENISSGVTGYTMKIQCNYNYTIPGTSLPVEVPVLLITPTDISVSDNGASIANMLTAGITDWLANKPQSNGGNYTFDFIAYSNTDEYVPILQLPLTLAVSAITS